MACPARPSWNALFRIASARCTPSVTGNVLARHLMRSDSFEDYRCARACPPTTEVATAPPRSRTPAPSLPREPAVEEARRCCACGPAVPVNVRRTTRRDAAAGVGVGAGSCKYGGPAVAGWASVGLVVSCGCHVAGSARGPKNTSVSR